MIEIKNQKYNYLFTVKCSNEEDFMDKQKYLIKNGFLTFCNKNYPITYAEASKNYRELHQDISKSVYLNIWDDKFMTYEINLNELLDQINVNIHGRNADLKYKTSDLTIFEDLKEFETEVKTWLEGSKMNLL